MQSNARVRRRFSSEDRGRLLAAYHESDLTQREFARRHGVSLSALVLWLRKSRDTRPAATGMSLIQLPGGLPGAAASRARYKIQFPNGLSLEVAPGFLGEELEQFCRVLRSL